ncbi:LOG family protein [Pseudomonas sp. M30-35]|uniref:LOG family protein n=1 Tax=Pseudomonas sp. M30-35 TaxID=1981174 RepID=UPI000B3CC80B|nr:LOG family protein [Pseudomonas sp. M30-35]ARU89341.1 cytochrome D ubiquinol oxidase subunit II [Pseudomonas sp. M30-35]
MPDEPDDFLARHFQTSGIDLRSKVDELTSLMAPANSLNRELYREMLITIIRMGQADRNRWDAKIMLQTLREMEHAFSVLEQFKRRRKVTVFGSARTPVDHPIYQLARELGAQLARHDLMVVTGAGGGIMAAAHEGAGVDSSLGFNITLPFEQSANATVNGTSNLLSFHFFFLRKLFFVKEADALVLCPGGFGTLDEAIEVLTLIQTGKSPIVPVVLLDQPGGNFWQEALQFIERQLKDSGYILASDLNLMTLVYSADAAVEQISQFYSNYNSSRWLNKRYIIRLNHPLNNAALTTIISQFSDISKTGDFELLERADDSQDADELAGLPRLVFDFNGRNHGRLRELIDFINLRENWSSE